MQVPLNFYKVWTPAMRAHAKSLGKERFGIWGEFYVTPARYATMTGRGRDSTMPLGRKWFLGISLRFQQWLAHRVCLCVLCMVFVDCSGA